MVKGEPQRGPLIHWCFIINGHLSVVCFSLDALSVAENLHGPSRQSTFVVCSLMHMYTHTKSTRRQKSVLLDLNPEPWAPPRFCPWDSAQNRGLSSVWLWLCLSPYLTLEMYIHSCFHPAVTLKTLEKSIPLLFHLILHHSNFINHMHSFITTNLVCKHLEGGGIFQRTLSEQYSTFIH